MKTLIGFLLAVFLMRWAVLDNRALWEKLPEGRGAAMHAIGSTGRGLIWWEWNRSRIRKTKKKIIVAGDSVIHPVFRGGFEKYCGQVFIRDGMQVLDLWLHRHDLTGFRPQTLVIGFSEWSLTQRLQLHGIRHTAGLRPGDTLTAARLLFPWRDLYDRPELSLFQAVMAALFREYRYAPLARFGVELLAGPPPPPRQPPPPWQRQQKPDRETRRLTETSRRLIEQHLIFLERFLDEVTAAGIRVLVLELPLHPAMEEAAEPGLKDFVRSRVDTLTAKYRGVTLIRREDFGEFGEELFLDIVHMNGRGGRRAFNRIEAVLAQRGQEPLCPEIGHPGIASGRSARPES